MKEQHGVMRLKVCVVDEESMYYFFFYFFFTVLNFFLFFSPSAPSPDPGPSISTEVGVPEPPSGLVVMLVTHDSVFVEWQRPDDNGLPGKTGRFFFLSHKISIS